MKTKILICCFPSDLSGVPSYVRQICKIDSNKFEISILTRERGVGFASELLPPDVEVISRPELRNSMSIGSLMAFRRTLIQILNEVKPDVLHLNGTMFAAAGRLLKLPQGRRRVVTYHGVPFGPGLPILQKTILLPLETLLLNISKTRNIVISSKDRATLGKVNFSRRQLDYVPNAVPLVALPQVDQGTQRDKGEPIRLISTAVFRPQKNHALLLRAFGHLVENSAANYELLLVGRGTDIDEIKTLAEQEAGRAALPHISFMGERGDVLDLLAGADLFVLTSRYEGMPIAALEALAMGLPIVMTDVGGAEEICGGGSGIITFETPDCIASAVEKLAEELRNGRWDPAISRKRHAELFEEQCFLNNMARIYTDD